MAAAATSEIVIECGFCWRTNEDLEDPRVLPCTHAHCSGCFNAYFELHHVVQCPLPDCREVFDVTIANLPSFKLNKDATRWCDACTKKGKDTQPAVIYCTDCSKKFCVKHQEYHDEINDKHSTTSIEKYEDEPSKTEQKTCSQHIDSPYTAGCKECLKVICAQCLDDLDICTTGKNHELLYLGSLVTFLGEEIEKLKVEMKAKESEFEKLFKTASKTLSEFEAKTKEMLVMLRKTRDEQIGSIRSKYDQLEAEFIKQREKTKEEISVFMESNVGVKCSDLKNHRLKLDARMKHGHQYDIVKRYDDTREEIQRLVNEKELPLLHLRHMVELGTKDLNRNIELKIIDQEDASISIAGLTPSPPPTTSLTLHQTVGVPKSPPSIYHHKGVTYVGLQNNTATSIDSTYQLTSSSRSFTGRPVGITVHNDKIYYLVSGTPYQVIVHDLSGNQVTQWNHIDTDEYYNKLVVLSNQVVVPDRQNKRLSIYSLTGQTIKQIAVPQLSGHYIGMCAIGNEFVVISVLAISQVFMVDVGSGEVVWTCSDVDTPQGVTCYRGRHVYVASWRTNKIYILGVKTGAVLAELSDTALGSGKTHMLDLHISDDTLIVPHWTSSKVLYYKMNK